MNWSCPVCSRPKRVTPTVRKEIEKIWRAGNDFTMGDIAKSLGLSEAQVRYAVRNLPKSKIQRARHMRSRRVG